MKFDVLHNFISPVTGRILSTDNYVLVGNNAGIAIPSPDLIDLKLDLINLRVDFDVASSASYILGFSNSRLPNAQVLHSLSDGFIFNTAGLISTIAVIPITSLPDLPWGNIWIGNVLNRPVANPTININNLPNLSSGKVWIGDGLFPSRPVEGDPPQGPQGPQGPPGAAGGNPSNVVGNLIGTALGELVKAGIQELIGGGGSLIGGIVGATVGGLVVGGTAALIGGVASAAGAFDPTESSLVGPAGAAGTSGQKTIFLNADMSFAGNRLKDIAPSPQADYDAVSAKWVWDLLNDNVEIIWG